MSSRGSRPKIASDRETLPASFPSRVLTLNSMFLAPLLRSRLDGVANNDPSALGAGDGTLDEDQAAAFVGGHDFEVLGGDARLAHVTSHALALPDLARILVVTSRTVRTVRYGYTVGRTQTAEVVALHGAGEALTDRSTS